MKLQTKLLLAFIPVIVVSTLSLGWIVFVQLRNNSEEELLMQMQQQLDQAYRQSHTLINTTEANALLFASSSLIERYVLVEDESERFDLLQPALYKLFASYRMAYPSYREIRLVMPDGFEDTRLVESGLINRTEEEAGSDWFQQLSRKGSRRSLTTTFIRNPDDGSMGLVVTRAIKLAEENELADWATPRLRGYLSVTANTNALFAATRQAAIGNTGHLLLFHRDGTELVAGSVPIAESEGRNLIKRFRSGGTRLAADSMKIQVAGERSLVKGRWLHPDLLLVAVLPESEFFFTRRQLAMAVAAVMVAAILLGSMTLFILLRSLVIRPVRALRRAAVAIGNGDDYQAPAIAAADELGDLASAFDDMHLKLESSNARLGASLEQLKTSHARIEQLAYRDSLTNLPNRRQFIELAHAAIEQATAEDTHMALLFLDLDDFKKVNDSLGHEAGDELLREVARRLQSCVRSTRGEEHTPTVTESPRSPRVRQPTPTPVARLGGDEFIILLDVLPSAELPMKMAERIIEVLTEPVLLGDESFVVGTSIGIAHWPEHAADVSGLIKCADMAMYEAKRQGKNTYRRYGLVMQARLSRRLALEKSLRQALANDDLRIAFQPQLAMEDRSIIGVEALLRWNHPIHGAVPPELFVSIAEEIGLIGKIGEWVLREACHQWRRWLVAGLPPTRLAVNVSQRQLQASDFCSLVQRILTETGMHPGFLELEITETCMMEAPSMVVDTLGKIRRLGVRVALDDFGTGYSSLSALTALPIDTLKIDRGFIVGIRPNTENDKVVSAILALAHSLNLEIVAEGVETEAEFAYLAERRCAVVQGFLIGHALPASGVTRLLATDVVLDMAATGAAN